MGRRALRARAHARPVGARGSHAGTEIDAATRGGVELAWRRRRRGDGAAAGARRPPAGLAFDPSAASTAACRPRAGSSACSGRARPARARARPRRRRRSTCSSGAAGAERRLRCRSRRRRRRSRTPRGLAVDGDDRLFVAETDARRILVYDLWSRRLLRRIGLLRPSDPGALPLDLAAHGTSSGACSTTRPASCGSTRPHAPVPVELPARPDLPRRAAPRGSPSPRPACSSCCDDGAGRGVDRAARAARSASRRSPRATDLEFDGDGVLVVARAPRRRLRALPPRRASGDHGATRR